MKKLIAASLIICSLTACSGNPLSATTTLSDDVPISHLCTTQPRIYFNADDPDNFWYEVDTYTQAKPCPAVPID